MSLIERHQGEAPEKLEARTLWESICDQLRLPAHPTPLEVARDAENAHGAERRELLVHFIEQYYYPTLYADSDSGSQASISVEDARALVREILGPAADPLPPPSRSTSPAGLGDPGSRPKGSGKTPPLVRAVKSCSSCGCSYHDAD